MQNSMVTSQQDNNEAISVQATVNTTSPGQIRVIKRNGSVVAYQDDKISIAITKAFLAIEGDAASQSSRIRETVEQLTDIVSVTLSVVCLQGVLFILKISKTKLNWR